MQYKRMCGFGYQAINDIHEDHVVNIDIQLDDPYAPGVVLMTNNIEHNCVCEKLLLCYEKKLCF